MATPEVLAERRTATAPAAPPGRHPQQEAHRRAEGRRCAYVVDDDPDTRHLIGDVATELGWEAKRFSNLREVRSALADESPDVLILDDILDTGHTLTTLVAHLADRGAHSVRTAVLLRKRGRQEVAIEPDYCGFEIPDRFAIGYGLDYAQRYRNLDYVAVLAG